MSAEQTEQETRWRVLREKLADVRLGGVSPPYVREVCDDVMAHCASLEQQVAEMTKKRDHNRRLYEETLDLLAGRDIDISAVERRADASALALVKMREQLRKLPRYWSRVAMTPQVRSVPSVLWVDVERVLSALLDPQDQP